MRDASAGVASMGGGPIAGVILAGGRSRRLGGGDKALLPLGGGTLLDRVIVRVRPQVAPLVLNANGDPARFGAYRLPVVADTVPGFAGPLAGILAGLDWAAAQAPHCTHLASFACDSPFVPPDLVARLAAALVTTGADCAIAASAGRDHPVFGLWPLALRQPLRRALVEEGMRRAGDWVQRAHCTRAVFSADPFDPFLNINAPADLAALRDQNLAISYVYAAFRP